MHTHAGRHPGAHPRTHGLVCAGRLACIAEKRRCECNPNPNLTRSAGLHRGEASLRVEVLGDRRQACEAHGDPHDHEREEDNLCARQPEGFG